MIRRRLVVVASLLVLGALAAALAVSSAGEVPTARFASLRAATTPFVPLSAERLTSSYTCPGVPAAADQSGGEVVVTNPTDAAIDGVLTTFGIEGPIATVPFEIAPRSSQRFDVGSGATEGYVASLVEIRGSGAVVQQQATLPEGTSVAPCSNDTASAWTIAAAATLDARVQLLLSNPYADAAVVTLTFATAGETRSPNQFQDFVVPSRSVRVVELDQVARDEAQLSVTVESRRGRLVVGRAYRYDSSARQGASVGLGSPDGATQWLFADGEIAEGVDETYTIVNTGEQAASVDVSMFPMNPPTDVVVPPISLEIAPGRSVTVRPADLSPGFTGRYGASIAAAGDSTVVAEHTITRGDAGTSVTVGSRFGSPRWWMPSGLPQPVAGALVVFNASGNAGTVTVSALGPGGAQPLPGLEDVAIAGAGIATFDLPAEAAGLPVVVGSTGDVSLVVEQFAASGSARSGSLAVPE